tara:strand:- start:332 stop:622 length:291 start_codon:yes stop_codon:yes gene_type:complete
MTNDQYDMDIIIDDISSELALLSQTSEPYYIISGSGDAWYHDVETKQLVMVSRGTEIVPMPEDPNNQLADDGMVLARAPYRFLWIPENEILEIGWN